MIWERTKRDHNLSINPWVRAWVRGSWVVKALLTLGLTGFLGMVWLMIRLVALGSSLGSGLLQQRGSSPLDWLGSLAGFLFFLVPVVLVADRVHDDRVTRADITRLMAKPDIVLATRAEYIGGHPKLPHGRFVYLALGGSLEAPHVTLILPGPGETQDVFSMPVVDVEQATEGVGEAEETVSAMLAKVILETEVIGQRALLNVTYAGEMGRRHVVELGHFLFGDGEVQNWRNHIVCIQSEADTGEQPYGPWKSLPSSQEMKGRS